MPSDIQTYWLGWTRFCNRPCSSTCGGSTLAEAIANIAQDFAYFAIACAHDDLFVELQEVCALCYGDGTIPAKKRGAVKTCPCCRGKFVGAKHTVTWKPLTETTLCRLRDQCRAESVGAA